jgi:hypothetical protein
MNTDRVWIVALLAGLAFVTGAAAQSSIAERIEGDAVTSNPSKGVLLLAVRWDRRWNCGGFENAQLRVIGFDKLPTTKAGDEIASDILLNDAPLVMTKPVFDNYAFLVEPGDYGLSRLEIKVAKSRSDVGFFKVPRSKFLKDGQSLGGSFAVGAGEVIYLGHFYLDCNQQPILWRYYPEGREGFNGYLASLKKMYPGLDAEKVAFRLLQTKEFGNDYKLP